MKHFIFDLDGTLIDTEQPVLKTWQKTLSEYGHKFSWSELRCVLGVTTDIGLQRLNVTVDGTFIDSWQVNYAEFAQEATYFDGVREMLLYLKNNGCSVGAVSSRCKKEYQDFFNDFGFEKIFDAVVLEEDTPNHKPHPEPLLKYLQLAKADKSDCIYIGDMPGDVQLELATKNTQFSAMKTHNERP
jgi:HAD superfamily hydrolase (TIGR01549 family)